jgi:hypothetical protein
VVKTPEPTAPPVEKPKPIESSVQARQSVKGPEPISTDVNSGAPVTKPETDATNVTAVAQKPESVKKEPVKSKAMSKIVFVYCWAALRVIAGGLGALGIVWVARGGVGHSTLTGAFAAADVFFISSVLIELILFYKMWAAIQDGNVSITPVKAVVFLLIPFFNFYWALLMFTSFAEDCNSFMRQRSMQSKELPFVLFMVHSFLFILSEMLVAVLLLSVFAFIDIIGKVFAEFSVVSWTFFIFVAIAGLCYFVTHILVSMKVCDAVNALSE